ncbi:MAG: type I-E CRISPR-associated protein Cas5/CasD [Chitinimonas sp.]|nr:type I-E CRISPR-associated protein Cas5/CasD [Chitinimonas sp.]
MSERPYLVFRLYGPMAGWGDIAVGEVRPTNDHPSRSALLGLVAAALGVAREEDDYHRRLAGSYHLAIAMQQRGQPLADYHTVQRPPQRAKVEYTSRRDELTRLDKDELATTVSHRDYCVDTCVTAVIWAAVEDTPVTLEAMAQALRQPHFTLYLGRKSCPLALPVQAQVVVANDMVSALTTASFKDEALFDRLRLEVGWRSIAESWIYSDQPFPGAHLISTRRDEPLSRARWQFLERQEYCRPPQGMTE